MTYAPKTVSDAARVWTAHGGLNAGIVGSTRTHCKGYHLGRDRIYSNCACRPNGKCQSGLYGNDYSASLARDRAGLTNAAMAFDAGPIRGSYGALRQFTRWLITQCQANTADTQDIREIIGTRDGVHVVNWLRDRGTDSAPEPGGDSTHLYHTHISYYRDTEAHPKTALFRRYFGATPTPPTPKPPQEDDMPDPTRFWPLATADVAPGGDVYDDPDRNHKHISGWAGGTGIFIAGGPDRADEAGGLGALCPILMDDASGAPEDLHWRYVGWDKISNVAVKLPGD